jgi:hypothetical protein
VRLTLARWLRIQPKVTENLRDYTALQARRDDLQFAAAAVRGVLRVDFDCAF